MAPDSKRKLPSKNAGKPEDVGGPCFNCGKLQGAGSLCFGCNAIVCDECDKRQYTGRMGPHYKSDHLIGDNEDEDD